MKMNMKRLGWLFACCLLFLSQTVFCEVRLPALINDGMVLQREAEVKIWGWADNPEDSNLYNKEGLPTSPFRT